MEIQESTFGHYAAGVQENFINLISGYECPCATGSTQTPPSYVSNDYFCESDCPGYYDLSTLHRSSVGW